MCEVPSSVNSPVVGLSIGRFFGETFRRHIGQSFGRSVS